MSVVASEQGANYGIIELAPIVRLERENRELKLCLDVGIEIEQNRKNIGFSFEWKGPDIVGVIIKHNQVEFISRDANNGDVQTSRCKT